MTDQPMSMTDQYPGGSFWDRIMGLLGRGAPFGTAEADAGPWSFSRPSLGAPAAPNLPGGGLTMPQGFPANQALAGSGSPVLPSLPGGGLTMPMDYGTGAQSPTAGPGGPSGAPGSKHTGAMPNAGPAGSLPLLGPSGALPPGLPTPPVGPMGAFPMPSGPAAQLPSTWQGQGPRLGATPFEASFPRTPAATATAPPQPTPPVRTPGAPNLGYYPARKPFVLIPRPNRSMEGGGRGGGGPPKMSALDLSGLFRRG